MQKLKGILAVLCLLVFLFPQVESELHSYAHMNDFHCTDHNSLHLHKADHHCFLCDYTNVISTTPTFIHQPLELHASCILKFFFQENNYLLQPKDFLSLRAPPSLA